MPAPIKVRLDAARKICQNYLAGQVASQTKSCYSKRTYVVSILCGLLHVAFILISPIIGLDSELRAQDMSSLPPTQQPQLQPPAPTGPALSSNIQRSTSPFPFLISRTPSQNLPVYETAKNGGNRHITSIRKISGDIEELATAVRDALSLPQYIVDVKGRKKETVAINWTTKQVVIRGWRGAEVKKWAELSGF